MSHDVYESPLAGRYASPYMLHLFSPDMRFQTWRRLWTALARAQHDLGLPVTEEQVRQLEQHITDIDYDTARQREREVRHDVMAHVYTYGKAAPLAAGIIHLGATSCYVTDNADLILYRDGLRYLRGQLLAVMKNLSAFAEKYAATPTLGYTHYQPAQPVTVTAEAELIRYTITYDPAGGTLPQGSPTQYTIVSDDLTLPTPTHANTYLSFEGWKDADGNTVATVAKGSTGDLSLTAQWKESELAEAVGQPTETRIITTTMTMMSMTSTAPAAATITTTSIITMMKSVVAVVDITTMMMMIIIMRRWSMSLVLCRQV